MSPPLCCSPRLHGTNFVGANRELKEFYDFLSNPILQHNVDSFCVTRTQLNKSNNKSKGDHLYRKIQQVTKGH